ncbi:MAG: signal peptidase I [Anaerolineales bacterium]
MVASVFIFVLIVWLVRRCLMIITIEQNSMFPALEPGDRVLVTRCWPARWAKKGQVVLVSLEGQNSFFVKRIVALLGETFHGDVLCLSTDKQSTYLEQRSWHIPPGHFFVCGDNANSSTDSRSWGSLPFTSLRGRVFLRLANSSIF